jgi:Leucine-rich repeat (LRR) protein
MLFRHITLLTLIFYFQVAQAQMKMVINGEVKEISAKEYDSLRQVWSKGRDRQKLEAAKIRLSDSESLDRSSEKLNLSGLGLKKLPKHTKEFTKLNRLLLSGNELKRIPKKILLEVKYLDLSNNPLSAKKFRFKRNRSITYLKFESNQSLRPCELSALMKIILPACLQEFQN